MKITLTLKSPGPIVIQAFHDNLQRLQREEGQVMEACRQRLYGVQEDSQDTEEISDTGVQRAITTIGLAVKTGKLKL